MYLLDANIVLRYLIGDGGELYDKSQKIISSLESGKLQWILPNYIIMEILFVMTWYYWVKRSDIAADLRRILALNSIVNDDKMEILEALFIYESQNIDFADALLVATQRLQWIEVISFDKKINSIISKI